MTDWLYDTFVWTGLLIGLVLLIRRPVARYFGPQVAYALWALPFIRLILPPLVLPAWMAPSDTAAITPATSADPLNPALAQILDEAMLAPATPTPEPFYVIEPATLTAITLAVWLGGAAVFLALRIKGYWEMRELMLTGAKEMGASGTIRLVETPAATAPLAFGVFDKVVALPPGFLAMYDRDIRDLAVAHELAHHHGRDLLVNILMQPLFALHWFNPLGHYGWQALRRDQEAACDARVVEHRPEEKRADYARVIASFAAGPNVALAAPMACPVLGEKSIIERLRSLKMSKQTRSRRIAGRVMLAGALVALPLTATISYAESQTVEEAFADSSIPEPPAPPAPPAVPGAPEAPLAPLAPVAPIAPEGAGPDDAVWHEIDEVKTPDGKVKRIEKVYVIKGGENMSAEEREEMFEKMREERHEAHEAHMEARAEAHEAHMEPRKVRKMVHAELVDARAIAEEALKEVELELASMDMDGEKTVVQMRCEGDEMASQKKGKNGENVVMICKSKIMAEALSGLNEARAEIASDTDMDAETKAQVLRSLDEQIRNWDKPRKGA